MLNHPITRTVLCLVTVATVFGCGAEEAVTSGAPAQDEANQEDSFALQPPSMALPPSGARPLSEVVSFVSCDEADAHVGGALRGSAALVTPESDRVCYIEIVGDDPIRYAGALIGPKGFDAKSLSIVDLIHGGVTAITASAGFQESEGFGGTDPNAPAGGFAEFAVSDDSTGRVVRIREDRTQAMFSVRGTDGVATRVEVTSNRLPDDVVAMARGVYTATGTASQEGAVPAS